MRISDWSSDVCSYDLCGLSPWFASSALTDLIRLPDGSSPPKSADQVGHGGAALRASRFESQGELGALAWRAAHVQVDAHGCGEAAGDVEAEPRAGHAPLGVQALEALEDPLLVAQRDPRTVGSHRKRHRATSLVTDVDDDQIGRAHV